MSGNTTAIERLLEVSNKLWDAMYESGEVPMYAERAHYYLALKDAMDEETKLLRLLQALALCADDNADCDKCVMNGAVYSSVRQTFCDGMADELRAVGIEVSE